VLCGVLPDGLWVCHPVRMQGRSCTVCVINVPVECDCTEVDANPSTTNQYVTRKGIHKSVQTPTALRANTSKSTALPANTLSKRRFVCTGLSLYITKASRVDNASRFRTHTSMKCLYQLDRHGRRHICMHFCMFASASGYSHVLLKVTASQIRQKPGVCDRASFCPMFGVRDGDETRAVARGHFLTVDFLDPSVQCYSYSEKISCAITRPEHT
jgi:hypothetical protein